MFTPTRWVFSTLLLCAGWWGSAAAQARTTDQWLERPVDDATFRTYLDFFVYDERLAFEIETLGVEQIEGLEREHLSFISTPGERVTAHLYRPPGTSDGPTPGIVLLHGGSRNGKASRGTELIAAVLARAGWTVLATDMQYYGERSTGLLQTFTEQEKHEQLYNQPSTYLAWITQDVKDARRAIDFLVRERDVDPERIVLVGWSRGAQVAMIVGGAEQRFRAVVLLHGGHFDRLETGHLGAACPANYIGRISPRPLLMLNGKFDADYFRATSIEPLQRLAGEPHLFQWAETGHGVLTDTDLATLVEWLREAVP